MERINYAQNETIIRDGRKWVAIPHTDNGDYVGSSVERSNCESIIKVFKDETARFWISDWSFDRVLLNGGDEEPIQIMPSVKIIIVDYDYSGRSLFGLADDEEIQNILCALEDYPIFDENHFLHLENSIHAEYIQEIINEAIRESEQENVPEETVCEMFDAVWDFLSENNMEIHIETGCLPYMCQTDYQEVKEMLIEEFFTTEEQ